MRTCFYRNLVVKFKSVALKVAIAAFALFAFFFYFSETKDALGDVAHTWDDAYMITRYAKHKLMHNEFSWNVGDGPAYGITCPFYLILVTGLLKLTACSDAVLLTFISYTAGLLSVIAMVALGFIILANKHSQWFWAPWLVIPAILLMPPFHIHSLTGMETTFSLFWNAALACCVALTVRQCNYFTFSLCLFCGMAAYATRPDNGIYALFLPPVFFVATDKKLWMYAIKYVLLFALFLVCSLIANKLLFGDFLPLPFFAKMRGFYHGYVGIWKWNAMKEMLTFLTSALPFLLLIIATISKRSAIQLIVIIVMMSMTFIYYATVTQIMGWHARYYYPSLPFLVFAAFISLSSQPGASPTSPGKETFLLRWIISLIVLLLTCSTSLKDAFADFWGKYAMEKPTTIKSRTVYELAEGHALQKLGRWNSIMAICELLKNMPSNIIFAASEYGFIGSQFPELTIIDLVGLHERRFAHKNAIDGACVLLRTPDLIWFPHPDYTGLIAQILDHPVFQSEYVYYPGLYDYGIALYRKSKRYAEIETVFRTEFARLYPGKNITDYIAKPLVPHE